MTLKDVYIGFIGRLGGRGHTTAVIEAQVQGSDELVTESRESDPIEKNVRDEYRQWCQQHSARSLKAPHRSTKGSIRAVVRVLGTTDIAAPGTQVDLIYLLNRKTGTGFWRVAEIHSYAAPTNVRHLNRGKN